MLKIEVGTLVKILHGVGTGEYVYVENILPFNSGMPGQDRYEVILENGHNQIKYARNLEVIDQYLTEGIKRGKVVDEDGKITIKETMTRKPKSIKITPEELETKETEIRKAAIDVKTSDGEVIKTVDDHAIDAMLVRNVSVDDVINILKTKEPIAGKSPNEARRVYIDPINNIHVVVRPDNDLYGVVRKGK